MKWVHKGGPGVQGADWLPYTIFGAGTDTFYPAMQVNGVNFPDGTGAGVPSPNAYAATINDSKSLHKSFSFLFVVHVCVCVCVFDLSLNRNFETQKTHAITLFFICYVKTAKTEKYFESR